MSRRKTFDQEPIAKPHATRRHENSSLQPTHEEGMDHTAGMGQENVAPPAAWGEAIPIQGKNAEAQAIMPKLDVPAKDSGSPLSDELRVSMESAFNTDFSSVRVHQDNRADAIGASAYARGENLHFSPGTYSPGSREGRRLVGHELAHVVQQRQGKVASPGGAAPLNLDSSLERDADVRGDRAAQGQDAGMSDGAMGTADASGPVQGGTLPKGGGSKGRFAGGIFGVLKSSLGYEQPHKFTTPSYLKADNATEEGPQERLDRTIKVFRVEGDENERLTIVGGNVDILNNGKKLYLNFEDRDRAEQYYLKNRINMKGRAIKIMEMPAQMYEILLHTAVAEREGKKQPHRSQISSDVNKTKKLNQFGVSEGMVKQIQEAYYKGSGKILVDESNEEEYFGDRLRNTKQREKQTQEVRQSEKNSPDQLSSF